MDNEGTIVLVEPSEGEGIVALSVSYGVLETDATVEQFLEANEIIEVIDLVGPKNMNLRLHVVAKKEKFGPIFLGDKVVFTPFLVFANNDVTLHCDECGRIVVEWIVENQHIWQEKYYGDWRTTHGAGNGAGSQRVH